MKRCNYLEMYIPLIAIVINLIYCVNSFNNDIIMSYKSQIKSEIDEYKIQYSGPPFSYYKEKIFSNDFGICYFISMIMLLSLDENFIKFFEKTTFDNEKQPVSTIIQNMYKDFELKPEIDLRNTVILLNNLPEFKNFLTLEGGSCGTSLSILLKFLYNENKDDQKPNFFTRYICKYDFYIECEHCNSFSVKKNDCFILQISKDIKILENFSILEFKHLINLRWICQNKNCKKFLNKKIKRMDCSLGQILFFERNIVDLKNSNDKKFFPPIKIMVNNAIYKLIGIEIVEWDDSFQHSYMAYFENNDWIIFNDNKREPMKDDHFDKKNIDILLFMYKQDYTKK